MTNLGTGIKVATFEIGLFSSYLSCIGLWPRPATLEDTIGWGGQRKDYLEHSNNCFYCLRNATPNATHYHHAEKNYTSSNSQAFLNNNGINNVSISYSNIDVYNSGQSLIMDDYSFNRSNARVLFCNPAGNGPPTSICNWYSSYNGLHVGQIQHTNLTTYTLIVNDFNAQNPVARFGTARDRELPEILAPGIRPTADTLTDPTGCLPDSFPWYSGTSFATPTVSGVCANLRSCNIAYKYNPEMIRSIVMVTSQNISGAWNVAQDSSNEAGVISGHDAEVFALSYPKISANNTPCVNGIDFRAIQSTQNYLYYYILIPATLPANKHLRVVLTWDSRPNIDSARNYLTDLNMGMWVSGTWYNSCSREGNYELINVPAAAVTPNAYYTLTVAHTNKYFPPDYNWTYMSVAWTWVNDFAN